MYDLMDFICMISGGYLLYAGIVMKTQGKINANVVLSKGISENAIRDKEEFIRYLYGKLILIGAVIVLSDIVSLVIKYQGGDNGTVSRITFVIFIVAMVVYAVVVSKALKKYTS
ncbi:MAG: hypothetical protein HDR30_09950 [Lachnospiraceae bacterium]|nr:hypothetical protein [Lachnospiraceae bacterium]